MSNTTVYGLYPENKKFEEIAEYGNGHGSAPPIWDYFIKTYYEQEHWVCNSIMSKLWNRWQDLSISECERALLLMTFDRAYIAKEYYGRASKDIEEFLKICPPKENNANHWPTIKKLLESNPDVPAIGFQMTSVSENCFEVDWDEETEEPIMADWNDCVNIYEYLDSLCCNAIKKKLEMK